MKLKSGQTAQLTKMSNERYKLSIMKVPRFDSGGRLSHHVFVGNVKAIFEERTLSDSFVTTGEFLTYAECKKYLHNWLETEQQLG